MRKMIKKRNGAIVAFDASKIAKAVEKALRETDDVRREQIEEFSQIVADVVCFKLDTECAETPEVEHIQDLVEDSLMGLGMTKTAKAYVLYRAEHSKARTRREAIMNLLEGKFMDVSLKGLESEANRSDTGNANVDTMSPMGKMLVYGSETSKAFALENMVSPRFAKAHKDGDIHIHDLDFWATGTLTCCQIDLKKLFENGFSTGHGYLREPQSIGSYAALAAIAIQANQNDQHGGQSIPMFDYYMAPGVLKTFKKEFRKNLANGIEDLYGITPEESDVYAEKYTRVEGIEFDPVVSGFAEDLVGLIGSGHNVDSVFVSDMFAKAYRRAYKATEKATYQAMEGFIHNLNTMHSRAGAQVPFSSINYGTDISPEGRMVMRSLLFATEAGLGNGETPIFPIQIFKVKDGVSYGKGAPNEDLFDLACRVSAKRLFPNFSFLDTPFNAQYYVEGKPESEATYMGCRTRVIGNVNGEETVTGRGNLSFTSINMPRLAIEAKKKFPGNTRDDIQNRLDEFGVNLLGMMNLCLDQLLERMAFQASQTVRNFPFLMGQGVWRGSEDLGPDDTLAEVIKQGTLSIGFIGLAETLKELIGVHHGESDGAQDLGLQIIKSMRTFCDEKSKELGLNVTLLATPAEGLSGRFTRIDRDRYGVIEGVTDRDYYTNSFHVPVYYNISAFRKIKTEAPYHALTNAGHISYVELDGDPLKNLEAFKAVVAAEKEAGMGYASINHPVDRDPCCGYTGIIDNVCPQCGRKEDDGQPKFERIRRITGYLVGTMDKWNDSKAAEEADRVKHTCDCE